MKETVIPEQREGSRVDTDFQVAFESRGEAMGQFRISSLRLLNLNQWHLLCGLPTAKFELISADGVTVEGQAMQGDYFRISIPGPGTTSGDGYDWVRIEQIEQQSDHASDLVRLSMRVRPTSKPTGDASDVAHFFGPQATSTFRVERSGNVVTASVHGRNEVANDTASSISDKVRNTIVSLGARAGISEMQWKSLVKGIVEGPPR